MDGVMNPGIRHHKSASLRVAIAECLPVEMWEGTREIVSVKSENQARGEASGLMWAVCSEADRAGLVLIVQPLPFAPGLDIDRLKNFYKKFDFVVIQDEPCLMSRPPERPPRIARTA